MRLVVLTAWAGALSATEPVHAAELKPQTVEAYNRYIRLTEARMDAELQPDDVLRTIPGVGQHLAPVLLGVLHTAERFQSERHLRGFCGLFPRRADSGGAEKPGQTITQGGNDRVKRALMLQGVQDSQVATVSYGEERPAAAGSDENAYSKNRRVEIVYIN